MGKKTKTGKQRKDKFYQLAKETGFRSRAAFKLIQLNRKFEFLQRSQVLIDLCAAPGGWMQVAKQNMPVNSIVVGVDLFPIKSVPGCISIVGDITTDKCRSDLGKELQTWKADCVLHDGAPNVGQNWIHDAYQQACLTLSALKLATHFLKQGGWFVTKVFRSKDYNPLLWVLKQLFRKVHATKPQASRNESAEIFVVCQYYFAPAKLDGRFLDPRYVFKELDMEPANKINLLHPDKQKKLKAEGYSELRGVFHTVPAADFITAEDPLSVLQVISAIDLNDPEVANHPTTTPEIKECCKDIKVLGRKDLRALITWAKGLKNTLFKEDTKEDIKDEVEGDEEVGQIEMSDEEKELEEMEKLINELEDEELKALKRKKKRANRERTKLQEKLNLKMIHKSDDGPVEEDTQEPLFNLDQISSREALENVDEQTPDVLAESQDENSDDDSDRGFRSTYVPYKKESGMLDDSGKFYAGSSDEMEEKEEESDAESSVDELAMDSEEDSGVDTSKKKKKKKQVRFANNEGNTDEEDDDEDSDLFDDDLENHPLLRDLDTRDAETRRLHKAQLWFEKDSFKGLEKDEDEEFELEQMAASLQKKGAQVTGGKTEKTKTPKNKKAKEIKKPVMKPEESNLVAVKNEDGESTENGAIMGDDSSSDDSDDSSGSEYEFDAPSLKKKKRNLEEGEFEIVPKEKRKKIKLNERELALGAMMVASKKTKRDLVDEGWNRYAFNDENLPDWFVEDEQKHMKKEAPVPQELEQEYKKKFNELNIRPIKKVIEAKARKKKRMQRRLEKAKKKLEGMMDNPDVSEKEKIRQVKKLYKKEPKKEVTYIVGRKSTAAKRMRRPPGVKGRFKVVDPRMKKDMRATRAKESKMKKSGRMKKGGNVKKGGKTKKR
ncbi:ribosomal RNA methyltransferase [Nesidiocoris tenuis]|uniref:Putative rRNA methyltransferase n=1 Tax=Nesidiocoris tenuis TaxID=355587 RepID=A0ABN7B0H2_9HEMI|nr:ribosomal RNA methyltransferase [Nesidiocoris tenuis]